MDNFACPDKSNDEFDYKLLTFYVEQFYLKEVQFSVKQHYSMHSFHIGMKENWQLSSRPLWFCVRGFQPNCHLKTSTKVPSFWCYA